MRRLFLICFFFISCCVIADTQFQPEWSEFRDLVSNLPDGLTYQTAGSHIEEGTTRRFYSYGYRYSNTYICYIVVSTNFVCMTTAGGGDYLVASDDPVYYQYKLSYLSSSDFSVYHIPIPFESTTNYTSPGLTITKMGYSTVCPEIDALPIIGDGVDSDGDGFSDSYESNLGCDPNNPDNKPIELEHDGQTFYANNVDGQYSGLVDSDGNSVSPANGDYDGDGVADSIEIAQGTNPADSSDAPCIVDMSTDTDGDGIPDGMDRDPMDSTNPSSSPWDNVKGGADVYDVRTGQKMGYMDGMGNLHVEDTASGFNYVIPRDDLKDIPIAQTGDGFVYATFPQIDNPDSGGVNPPTYPPNAMSNIVNNSDNSVTNNTINNDNSVTNNYSGDTVNVDMSGVEGRLDTANNHLSDVNDKFDEFLDGLKAPIDDDYTPIDYDSFNPDSFGDVFESIKTTFTLRKDSFLSKCPDFLKGDWLPDNVTTAEMPRIIIPEYDIDVPVIPGDWDHLRLAWLSLCSLMCYVALLYACWKVLAGGN